MNEIQHEHSEEQRLGWRLERAKSRAKIKAKEKQEKKLEAAGLFRVAPDTVIKIETAETIFDLGEEAGIDELGPALDMLIMIINKIPSLRELIRKNCASNVRPDNMAQFSGVRSNNYSVLHNLMRDEKKDRNFRHDTDTTSNIGANE